MMSERKWMSWAQDYPHQRLKGRREFKLRVGAYRVLYEFDLARGRIYLHYVGHRREIYKAE
jgi:mRNA-degrading endonuclease RelE of RelBE toxin-antitoxin system